VVRLNWTNSSFWDKNKKIKMIGKNSANTITIPVYLFLSQKKLVVGKGGSKGGGPTKSTFSNFENKMEKFFRKWTFIFVQNEFYVKSFGICLKGAGR
jgi:hypothetical protein